MRTCLSIIRYDSTGRGKDLQGNIRLNTWNSASIGVNLGVKIS